MKRILLLLVAVAAGAGLAWYFIPRPSRTGSAVHRAFARAKAYYLNENNADYRRARVELAPLAKELDDSVAYHLAMALIDLQEINYRNQDETRVFDKGDYELLIESALRHVERAHALDPDSDAVAYNRARTYIKWAPLAENDEELRQAAEKLLVPLTQRDPPDPSALMLYADLRWEASDYQQAFDAYDRIVKLGKDYVPETLFSVASLRRAQSLQRLDPAAGEKAIREHHKRFPNPPKATAAKLERGRYTRFLEFAEYPKTVADPRELNWQRLTARTGIPAVGDPPFFFAPDLDQDCARDLVINTPEGLRALRNRRNATFEDVTGVAGLPRDMVVAAGATGDLDNDGRMDLVLGGPAGVRVFLQGESPKPTEWRFAEWTGELDGRDAPVDCIAFWDFDHDGDLDLFVGGTPNRLYRTVVEEPEPGTRVVRLQEVGKAAGFATPRATSALILDVEDDQDVDLLVTGPDGNGWFENLRQVRFKRHELPAGEGLGAADVDNDLQEEVRIGGTVYKWSDGEWRRLFDRPALLDLDSDGVIDEDPFSGLEPRGKVLRAIGSDLNRDDGGPGGRDLLLLTDAGLDVYLSQPTTPYAWIDLQPRGLKSNEAGIGTRVTLYCDDLRIGTTCRDGLLSFGLGARAQVDAIMVRWTNGVEQGATPANVLTCLRLDEREGEVGSCPFLYTYDGEKWHFITDCQSGTPLGLPFMDRRYLPPRSSETIMVPGEKLAAKDGVFRLDVAEEFRELFYADHLVLRALDHPPDARPVLKEGFFIAQENHPAFEVHALGALRPPRAAFDQKGRDILAKVSAKDGRHAVVWDPVDSRYVGMAREWTITLDFGDLSDAKRILFVMDGWVEFPTASASIAASQSKTVHFQWPKIEAPGPDGEWKIIDHDPGFPAGKGKTVLVDLTSKLPTREGKIRIRSTQRLHWDAFLISTDAEDRPLHVTELPLVRAEHRFRGIGQRIEDPAGEQPWTYSHDRLVDRYVYDQMPTGMLTRYGDVLELLREIDDRYPVLAAGDVVELAYDATALPPLPDGWVRDFCFTTYGWVKDADMNQAIRESVGPLPYRAMPRYPYDPRKNPFPHPDFFGKWFTRPARHLVDPVDFGAPKPGAARRVK